MFQIKTKFLEGARIEGGRETLTVESEPVLLSDPIRVNYYFRTALGPCHKLPITENLTHARNSKVCSISRRIESLAEFSWQKL